MDKEELSTLSRLIDEASEQSMEGDRLADAVKRETASMAKEKPRVSEAAPKR